jgi:hypothetical protein
MAKNDDKTKNTGPAAEIGKQPEATEAVSTAAETTKQSETPQKAAASATAKKGAKAASTVVKDVDEFIAIHSLPRWVGESIKVFAGWKSGKQVTAEEFNTVRAAWNKRNQGAGRRA